MRTRRAVLCPVVCLIVVAMTLPAFAEKKKAGPTEPGIYKAWGPNIDQLEIVRTFRFADFTTIVVTPFETESTPLPDPKDNTYELAKKVLASATEGFVQGLRGSVQPKVEIEKNAGTSEGTLVIRGKVVMMDPGSKSKRFFGGIYGAGAAKTKIEGEIIDAKSGEVLARFTQERRSSIGVLAGDYQELMQRNLNTIGEDVANILKAF